MYESKKSGVQTESVTKVTGNVKYFLIANRPKFCSLPDVVKMLRDMMAGQYCYGKVSLEKAIENVKGYGATQNNIDKAIKLI